MSDKKNNGSINVSYIYYSQRATSIIMKFVVKKIISQAFLLDLLIIELEVGSHLQWPAFVIKLMS